MYKLSNEGQKIVDDLAQRYGVSNDAVMAMLFALVNGNGTMAQFNHPDFGGSGQWVRGGMTMVGDMFNYALKSRVEGLCSELSNLIANQQAVLFDAMNTTLQTENGQQWANAPAGAPFNDRESNGNWWPQELGIATSTGMQNNIRYAYFPFSCRLAVEFNGHITVYDTQDYQIGGVSQQQGNGASLAFSSQFGLVWIENLPVVTINSDASQGVTQDIQSTSVEDFRNVSSSPTDVFSTIERLAELRKQDILTEEEFSLKKAELLNKL